MEAVSKEDMGTDVIDVKLSSQVITFDVTEAAIQKLDEKYADGTMVVTDTKSYKAVVAAVAEVRGLRLKVEARRKVLKADALEHGRNVDSRAKQITALLAPIEERLNDVKKAEDDRKAEAKAELAKIEQARVDGIRKKISDILNMTTGLLSLDAEQLKSLSDEIAAIEIDMGEYMEFTQEAVDVKGDVSSAVTDALANRIKLDEEEAARKAEDARLQKIREEQEAEAKRLALIQKAQEDERIAHEKKLAEEQAEVEKGRKAEEERIAEIQRKFDADKKAADDKLAEERRVFEEEKAKVEADRKAEQDKKEREEFERKAKETATREAEEKAEADRLQAEVDAKAKADREEAERVEADAEAERAEALRPDKEWIINYLDMIQSVIPPKVTDDVAHTVLDVILTNRDKMIVDGKFAVKKM